VSVGMSLVISSGVGFDRIACVYAGSESRKSTESSSKSSRNLRADGTSRPQKPDILIFGRHRGIEEVKEVRTCPSAKGSVF